MASKICIVFSALFCIATCGPLGEALLNPMGSTTVCESSPMGIDMLPGLGMPLPYSGISSLPYSPMSPLGLSGLPLYQPMSTSTTVCETSPNLPVYPMPTLAGGTTICETMPSYNMPLGFRMTGPQMGATTVCETSPNLPVYPMQTLSGGTTVCETMPSYNMPLGYRMTAPQMGATTVCETSPNLPIYPMSALSGGTTVCETMPSYNMPLGYRMTSPQMGATTVCETSPNTRFNYPLAWSEASNCGMPYGFMMTPNAYPYGYPLGRGRVY